MAHKTFYGPFSAGRNMGEEKRIFNHALPLGRTIVGCSTWREEKYGWFCEATDRSRALGVSMERRDAYATAMG